MCEALERKLSILGRSRESEIRRVKREAANALSVSGGTEKSPKELPVKEVEPFKPQTRLH